MASRSRASDRLRDFDASPNQRENAATTGATGLSAQIDSPVALRAANSSCTILITGETGVGKGYLARWVHEHSPRAAGPFIPVNCGAIPDTLIDSQLFGHAKGAFSGASHDHLGLVRAADRGTLLLDEVSELPPSAQVRLLRLLQEREVQPVGYSRPILVDVRVIAASNIDLAAAVAQQKFREDLLFRLNVIQLIVPPLRDRLHELPGLIARFNAELARLYGQAELAFDPAALEMLQCYHWPGNIRQVRTLIERLHVLCPGEYITVDHIGSLGQLDSAMVHRNGHAAFERLKHEHLRKVLEDAGGSIARAAEMFGVHRSTIYRWLRDR